MRSKRIIRPLLGLGICLLIGAPLLSPSGWFQSSQVASNETASSTSTTSPTKAVALVAGTQPTTKPIAKAAKPKRDRPVLAAVANQDPAPLPVAQAPARMANRSGALMDVPVRNWLPPAGGPKAPRMLLADAQHPLHPPRAGDLPVLAMELPADLPVPLVFPAGVPVKTASIDPSRIFASDPPIAPDPRRATDSDPAAAHSVAAALSVDPPLRKTPGAFVKVSIPEPEDPERAVHVTTAVPDADPPVTILEVPAKPVLPLAHK